MNPNGTSRAAVIVSIVFALSVFSLGLFVWVSFGGNVPFGAEGYKVKVVFGPEASNLFPNAEARIAGVRVGRVTKVETGNGRVVATVELESRFAPMHTGAKAVLRSKTLLGEAFIQLSAGPKSLPPIPEGGSLAVGNVTTAQGVDRALSIFDEKGRADLRKFLTGLADATEGRGADVNAALGNAPMTTEDLRSLVDVLNEQRPALKGLVRDMGTTLQTVADHSGDVQQLARAGQTVFATTAARNHDLTQAIRETPALMRTLQRFGSATSQLSNAAAPAVRDLAPVVDRLEPGLRSARQFAPDLTAALTSLDRTNRVSRRAVPALSRILREASPLLKVLDPAGRQLVPVVKTLEAYRTDAVSSMTNTAATLNATIKRGDGSVKHYLRSLLVVTNELAYGRTSRQGTHRENAYPAPGALGRLIDNAPLTAISCADAGNSSEATPLGTGAPPCVEAQPFSLAGSKPGIIPQVTADNSRP